MVRKFFYSLLPEYANQSLSPWLTWVIKLWLKHDMTAAKELEGLRYLHRAVQAQVISQPSLDVWRLIQKRTSVDISSPARPAPVYRFWQIWGLGMTLIVLSLALFWYVLPPGIVLQWTVSGNAPMTFRIYRANSEQPQNYELLDEISTGMSLTSLDARVFTYRDLYLLPGQRYEYRIEMVDHNGSAYSQTIMSTAFQALPGQMALFLSFLLLGYGLFLALPKLGFLSEQPRFF